MTGQDKAMISQSIDQCCFSLFFFHEPNLLALDLRRLWLQAKLSHARQSDIEMEMEMEIASSESYWNLYPMI